MFTRVLIANRGEIAVRVAQTLREMGITAVGVYSEPDAAATHVASCDEAYPLPGVTSAETYLRGDRIIEIARTHGVDAIHPGYGFLSENARFAEACAAAAVTFIGPGADAIRIMGDKVVAKAAMEQAGVPVVPGWSAPPGRAVDLAAMRGQAETVGFPLLVKAASGGGGKGMRLVEEPAALDAALEAATREAGAAFGDARVFLERYLPRARHVEFQIFGDDTGNVVHLFERECSVQRRHQKIVEEAPSPGVDADLRQRMGEAAVRAARAIGYTNAGTVEFMVDDGGGFYFLEVNTRLQVEHPVTELTTGRDLVRDQLLVASGQPLPYAQADLEQRGHALECRVYAEDADRGFLPSTGTIAVYEPPTGPGIRVDSGVRAGTPVSPHYDPMLAKVIVHAATRDEAIDRMVRALERFVILGVTTNIGFLRSVVDHPVFRRGALHTQFLEEHPIPSGLDGPVPLEAYVAAALATIRGGTGAARTIAGGSPAGSSGPWDVAGGWRGVGA